MSRAVKQCIDQFLQDHKITLYPWQYAAMLEVMSNRNVYRLIASHYAGKSFLFETIELFIKERSNHVASEIAVEKNFNQL